FRIARRVGRSDLSVDPARLRAGLSRLLRALRHAGRARRRDGRPPRTGHRSVVAFRPAAPLGLREARTREPRGRLSSRRAGRRSPAAAAALPGSVAGGSAGGGRRRLCLLWAPCGYYPGRAPHIVISIVIPVFNSGDVMIRECHAAIAAVLAAIAEP